LFWIDHAPTIMSRPGARRRGIVKCLGMVAGWGRQ
jgi:hypothetical protein